MNSLHHDIHGNQGKVGEVFGRYKLDTGCIMLIAMVTALKSGYVVFRVTEEALIAETAVWPYFFLMNIFFALKGSNRFIII